jgi:hypothetical protein
MGNIQNVSLHRAQDKTFTFYGRDDDNLPKDLTGRVVTWRIGQALYDENVRPLLTVTATIISAAAGSFSVALDASQTDRLARDYEHSAILDDGSLTFINDASGVLQFENDEGGDLNFYNGYADDVVEVTRGRFRILSSIGG